MNDITRRPVVYRLPGADAVAVRSGVEYRADGAGPVTLDLYEPLGSQHGASTAAVVLALGYSDVGFEKILGCKQHAMASYVSWARLMAASGLAAITYTTTEPAADLHAVLQCVRLNATPLGIDGNRIGIWACSGSVPNALSTLMTDTPDPPKCAVFCYGHMLDLDGATGVADAAARFRFVTPCAGKSVEQVRRDVPLMIARAGGDEMPGVNESIDRFVGRALERDLPVTLVNLPGAPHAFDLLRDSDDSRDVIRRVLAFVRFHLLEELS